jgi:hypothetical protein
MASVGTGLIFAVVALIPTYLFVRARRASRAVSSTETRSTASLTDDVVAVSGTVEAGPAGTLTHPVTGADALAVRWDVEEPDDADEETVDVDDSGRQTVPFRLVDDDGSVDVDPTEADLHLSSAHYEMFVNAGRAPGEQALTFIERVQGNERRCHGTGTKRIHNTPINEATVHGTGGIQYESRALQPGDTGYVLGPARSDGDGTYTIGGDGEFLVSDMSRDALSESLGASQWLLAGAALLFYGIGAYFAFFG